MRRICTSALLASALYGLGLDLPAFADPLQVMSSPYVMSQPVYAAQQPAAAPAAGQQYYVYVAPPGYATTAQPSNATTAQPGYATAAPRYTGAAVPRSTGTVAPRYATAAPTTTYAAAAPQTYAAAPAAAPSKPGGGGFLEALFGGPTIQVPASHVYQPALPEYSAPAPQPTLINAPPASTPSGQGDMSAYPVDPKFDRQVVDYHGEEKPGTVIIDTPNKFLYLVEDDGRALRYGIGVGRPGFTWSGVKEISAKREWPDWRPPDDMLQRRPDLPRYMPGGIDNPLGARAMYLGSTLYRIHGSNEPWTIGTNVSSGCIRMRNDDVTDLYERVKIGTKVVVI